MAEHLFDVAASRGQKEKFLREALSYQSVISKEASAGQGIDRHLLALKKLAMGVGPQSPPLASSTLAGLIFLCMLFVDYWCLKISAHENAQIFWCYLLAQIQSYACFLVIWSEFVAV